CSNTWLFKINALCLSSFHNTCSITLLQTCERLYPFPFPLNPFTTISHTPRPLANRSFSRLFRTNIYSFCTGHNLLNHEIRTSFRARNERGNLTRVSLDYFGRTCRLCSSVHQTTRCPSHSGYLY